MPRPLLNHSILDIRLLDHHILRRLPNSVLEVIRGATEIRCRITRAQLIDLSREHGGLVQSAGDVAQHEEAAPCERVVDAVACGDDVVGYL